MVEIHVVYCVAVASKTVDSADVVSEPWTAQFVCPEGVCASVLIRKLHRL